MTLVLSRSKRIILIITIFLIGVAIGTSAFNSALAKNLFSSGEPAFPHNKNGQTYGSSADASSPDKEPELIKAYGIDGTIGYVLKKDLDGERPRNPQEALALQRNAPERRVIPLYDVEGEKVIGQFEVSKGKAADIK